MLVTVNGRCRAPPQRTLETLFARLVRSVQPQPMRAARPPHAHSRRAGPPRRPGTPRSARRPANQFRKPRDAPGTVSVPRARECGLADRGHGKASDEALKITSGNAVISRAYRENVPQYGDIFWIPGPLACPLSLLVPLVSSPVSRSWFAASGRCCPFWLAPGPSRRRACCPPWRRLARAPSWPLVLSRRALSSAGPRRGLVVL
jgi:hypothetical protein